MHTTPPFLPRCRLAGVVCALAACALLIASGCRESGSLSGGAASGQQLAQLQLEGLTGGAQSVTLEELAGQVVLLNFWGTWCPPCRLELPHIAELEKKYRGRTDFRLLAVSCARSPAEETSAQGMEILRQATMQYLQAGGLEMPTYADPGAPTRQAVDQAIGFEGYPTTLLIDPQGVIRQTWVGYSPGVEVEMERAVEQLLNAGRPQA